VHLISFLQSYMPKIIHWRVLRNYSLFINQALLWILCWFITIFEGFRCKWFKTGVTVGQILLQFTLLPHICFDLFVLLQENVFEWDVVIFRYIVFVSFKHFSLFPCIIKRARIPTRVFLWNFIQLMGFFTWRMLGRSLLLMKIFHIVDFVCVYAIIFVAVIFLSFETTHWLHLRLCLNHNLLVL
jgi:hypothetical protein